MMEDDVQDYKATPEFILHSHYYNPTSGFMSLRELIRRTRKQVDPAFTRDWYQRQEIPQVLVTRRRKIFYHKTIGDGHGYQADIILLPHSKQNERFIGMLTFINTSTRKAYIAKIRSKKTSELANIIQVWIDHVEGTVGKIKSITTDNELYKNNRIKKLFMENEIEQFVEVSGEHSKLGIINRFHRTLRDLLRRMMLTRRSLNWVNIVDDAITNYNTRRHQTLGKAPNDMTAEDIKQLNSKLFDENLFSIRLLNEYKVGDSVRYLVKKSPFSKGGLEFSKTIWMITGIEHYNIKIEHDGDGKFKKYWELLKGPD